MKALIAILVVLILALFGLGGFFVWNMMSAQQAQLAEQQEEQQQGPASGKKSTLGRMRTPKNYGEVLNNLSYAKEKSLDAVAWLEVPGTDINHIVMQGDDNRYYERRNEDGNEDIYGCYFLDYECALGARDTLLPNTVIYGHSDLKDSPDGPRFSQLFRFTDVNFAKEHPYMYLTSEEERYTFEIFAVYYTDTSFDYIQVNIPDETMLGIAKQAQSLSLYDYGVMLSPEDRYLTLSTCSIRDGTDGSHRFVVMGRLCPPEFEEKESAQVTQVVREPS